MDADVLLHHADSGAVHILYDEYHDLLLMPCATCGEHYLFGGDELEKLRLIGRELGRPIHRLRLDCARCGPYVIWRDNLEPVKFRDLWS